MPTLVVYVSGHGFGHASRDIEVIDRLRDRTSDLRIIVRTAVPQWLFDVTLGAPVEWRPLECDTGVVQVDSLTVDVAETLRRAAAFYAGFEERARREAEALRRWDAALVLGDIPPLAFAAAHLAGVPSIAVGNFSWDWIYDAYDETALLAPDLVTLIRDAYRHAQLALRLPLHAGFAPFRNVQDLPFIARQSRRDPRELRARFGLAPDATLVLPSFGGYGLRGVDLAALSGLEGCTIVMTADPKVDRRRDEDDTAPPPVDTVLPANVRLVPERDLQAAGFRYEDLVAAVDVVVTKPGYGIIAECAANGTAVLYTTRGRFPEYDVLVREMPRYVRCAFISNEALTAGDWQLPLDRLLRQTSPPRPDVTGADRVVRAVVAALDEGRAVPIR